MTPHPTAHAESWHRLPADAVFDALGSSMSGLSETEAADLRERYGPNDLEERQRPSALRILLRQFADFMIVVLMVAAVVSGLLGELVDAGTIVVIVALNGILGFTQEMRAERALEALAEMAAPHADVHRAGQRSTIPARNLVPGDLVYLDAGTIVPADLRLVEAHGLRTDEAALTGESEPVDKNTTVVEAEDAPLGDRKNVAYAGTLVTYGRALGVVVATGARTEFGRIADLLASTVDTETPLSRRLHRFGIRLAIGILILCAALFALGLMRGEPPLLMFMTAVSLAVAAIPEALPAVVTINLALGARKMASRNAVVRKLSAVEALGSVTYVCSDKTGTLTRNRMHVERFWIDGVSSTEPRKTPIAESLLRGLVLCNDARANAAGVYMGDPTETALTEAAAQRGIDVGDLDHTYPRLAEAPFDSERMRMSTLHPVDSRKFLLVTKGAAEAIIERSTSMATLTGEIPIDADLVLRAADEMAQVGLRVLAIAERRLQKAPEETALEAEESDLVLLGLVGLLDPPRDEAREAVAECRRAGITPVMITGDHPATATAIARRLEILQDDAVAVLGSEASRGARAYARVAPEQKLTIVHALQSDGEIVAMTGDGVNDAPALRAADVGVAMGITGTDVAKQASSIIVLDDDFATIVDAVREGRRIYDNIRRFIRYALTTNAGEVLTVAIAPLLGLPIPLLPAQILFINLLTDGLPGIALAAEPAERDVMERPPHPPHEGLLSRGLGLHVAWVGSLIAMLALGLQSWALGASIDGWQTMVFVALSSAQLWHVLAIRSERDSLYRLGLGSNLPLLGAVATTFAVLIATPYVPAFQRVLQTTALTPAQLALAILIPGIIFVTVEIEKKVRSRQATN